MTINAIHALIAATVEYSEYLLVTSMFNIVPWNDNRSFKNYDFSFSQMRSLIKDGSQKEIQFAPNLK